MPPRERSSITAPAPDEAHARTVRVSAETGEGLGGLVVAIASALDARHGRVRATDAPLVTRARQRRALEEARAELLAFAAHWDAADLPAPVAAVHLDAAVHALETLVGTVDVDDVLARVFSTFCVGK